MNKTDRDKGFRNWRCAFTLGTWQIEGCLSKYPLHYRDVIFLFPFGGSISINGLVPREEKLRDLEDARESVAESPEDLLKRLILANLLRMEGHAVEACQQYEKIIAAGESPWHFTAQKMVAEAHANNFAPQGPSESWRSVWGWGFNAVRYIKPRKE